MKKVFITGISGAGKSTVSEELQKRGIEAFDMDEVPGLCRWQHRFTGEEVEFFSGIGKDFLEAHDWVCDRKKLEEKLKIYSGTVVVVGIAKNQDDFLDLFDKIILLYCSPKTFLHRLTTRENNPFGKDTAEQELILGFFEKFEHELIEKGAIAINTEQPLDVVVEEVISQI